MFAAPAFIIISIIFFKQPLKFHIVYYDDVKVTNMKRTIMHCLYLLQLNKLRPCHSVLVSLEERHPLFLILILSSLVFKNVAAIMNLCSIARVASSSIIFQLSNFFNFKNITFIIFIDAVL